ncbi:MAG TPA: carotenoid oxygenase family protein [Thermoanaerobaculia bacterium]|jgi:carotenoid cleavage dioxygenase-like enzyme|nr:carotenoid oxygenase family protein [Thermoanaerobaculia bacterium]
MITLPVAGIPAVDHAPGLERAFSFVPAERTAERLRIEGTVPAFLRGTYYLNGPARFARGDVRYRHWLDGDGMVVALRFGGDCDGSEGVHLTARFVRGTKLAEEEAAGRALYRAFGTSFPDDRLVRGIALESPLNVSIYPFGDTLLAFGEQGLPWELDPETLETRGVFTFGGALNPVTPFAAHPKIDPETGELFNFGISFSAAQPSLNLYRFSAAGELIYRQRLALPEPRSLHDFCLAGRHVAFFLGPYRLDMESLREGRTLLDSLRWEPELGSRLLVARREDGMVVASVPVGEHYVLHGINAFEDPANDDRLIVDVLELDRPVYDQYNIPDLFPDVAPGRPVRLTVDLRTGALVDRREIAYDRAPDFPAIDPELAGRPYEDLWMLGISHTGSPGRKIFDQVVHASWAHPDRVDLWQAPPGHYLGGEPAFAANAAGGGAVICQRFDAAKGESAFLVFDAFDVAAGPVAVLPLEQPLHLGFHALFLHRKEAIRL